MARIRAPWRRRFRCNHRPMVILNEAKDLPATNRDRARPVQRRLSPPPGCRRGVFIAGASHGVRNMGTGGPGECAFAAEGRRAAGSPHARTIAPLSRGKRPFQIGAIQRPMVNPFLRSAQKRRTLSPPEFAHPSPGKRAKRPDSCIMERINSGSIDLPSWLRRAWFAGKRSTR
jgi:hypothetical protein